MHEALDLGFGRFGLGPRGYQTPWIVILESTVFERIPDMYVLVYFMVGEDL